MLLAYGDLHNCHISTNMSKYMFWCKFVHLWYPKVRKTKGYINVKNCVYTVKDVAEMLKISEKTAYRLVREKELFSILVRCQYRIPSC